MKKILLFSLLGILFFSCVNLDIPRKNAITDEVLMSNEAGMEVYITRLYTIMPFEDFKYMAKWGFNYSSWLGALGIEGTGEAANRTGDGDLAQPFKREDAGYWNSGSAQPFVLMHDANHLIETLPQYKGNFTEIKYNQYLGEAYFARAMAFYAMAKRFGGVPLVLKEILYPTYTGDDIARSSEEATWDQILSDFDTAISLMQATNVITNEAYGETNKYVVMAYKAEAMNYAGCVAKYNDEAFGGTLPLGASGVRVIGFDPASAAAASKKYFREAYKAANEVIKDGPYSLYKKAWKPGDPEAQYQNMVDMFKETKGPETMLVKEYEYPTYTHGIDGYSSPWSFRGPLSGGTCPTLDFVELFDGIPRYPDGTFRVTDGNSNTEGKYLMYENTMDVFANAEPRLRAYVILPGDVFRGKAMEVRAGIYMPDASGGIAPFYTNYSYSDATTLYQDLPIYDSDAPETCDLRLGGGPSEQKAVTLLDGRKMNPSGAEGPFMSQNEACLTGFHLRKYMSTDPNFKQGEGKSAQPFILMRYADVLLAAAEAAVELSLAGEPSPDGSDMLTVATTAINDIRERAGADLLTVSLTGNNASRDIVRKERRKELAFEHKTKWDLRRWRVQHADGRGGFWADGRSTDTFSSGDYYRWRGLYPFYSYTEGKYFFDAHFQWVSGNAFKYSVVDYYFEIPSGEVTKSKGVIDQQPNR